MIWSINISSIKPNKFFCTKLQDYLFFQYNVLKNFYYNHSPEVPSSIPTDLPLKDSIMTLYFTATMKESPNNALLSLAYKIHFLPQFIPHWRKDYNRERGKGKQKVSVKIMYKKLKLPLWIKLQHTHCTKENMQLRVHWWNFRICEMLHLPFSRNCI